MSISHKSFPMLGLAALLAASAPAFSETVPPDRVVRDTSDRLLDTLRKNQAEFRAHRNKLYAVVDQIVVPQFDWKYISQLVLARSWRKATPEQRTRFQNALQNTLVRTYAESMLNFLDVELKWKPQRLVPGATDATVQSEVLQRGQPPMPIDFVLHLTDDGWKVYDITVAGLSLVINFRTQIAAQIKRDGIETAIRRIESGQTKLATETKQEGPDKSQGDPQ